MLRWVVACVLGIVVSGRSIAHGETCPAVPRSCEVTKQADVTTLVCTPGDNSIARMSLMVRVTTGPFTRLAMESSGCSFRAVLPVPVPSEYYVVGIDHARRLVFEGDVVSLDGTVPIGIKVPRLSPPRLLGELALGGVVSIGGMFVGSVVFGGAICAASDCSGSDGYAAIGALFIGAYLGGIATFPLGVRWAGGLGDQTGSLGAAYAGTGIGIAVLATCLLAHCDRYNEYLPGAAAMLPPLGAVIGFNVSRRYRQPTRAVSIVPSVSLAPHSGAVVVVPSLRGAF